MMDLPLRSQTSFLKSTRRRPQSRGSLSWYWCCLIHRGAGAGTRLRATRGEQRDISARIASRRAIRLFTSRGEISGGPGRGEVTRMTLAHPRCVVDLLAPSGGEHLRLVAFVGRQLHRGMPATGLVPSDERSRRLDPVTTRDGAVIKLTLRPARKIVKSPKQKRLLLKRCHPEQREGSPGPHHQILRSSDAVERHVRRHLPEPRADEC